MEAATFAFAMDGRTDMMSLNPLEHTNFEMMGTIFGIGGVIFTLVMGRIAKRKQQAHEFSASESEQNAIDQFP